MSMLTSFKNQLLIAMPTLSEPIFKRTVVFICEHQVQGTIGLIINKPLEFPMQIVFDQLKIDSPVDSQRTLPVLFGGPTQTERGFVLHKPFGDWRSSLALKENEVWITTSNDIIRAIAANQGPKSALVTLGFAGWTENQLENEIKNNAWLVCNYKEELLYDVPFGERWHYAGSLLGVDMNQLTSSTGIAN